MSVSFPSLFNVYVCPIASGVLIQVKVDQGFNYTYLGISKSTAVFHKLSQRQKMSGPSGKIPFKREKASTSIE